MKKLPIDGERGIGVPLSQESIVFREVADWQCEEASEESGGLRAAYPLAPRYGDAFSILGAQCHGVSVDDVHRYIEQVISHRQQALVLNLNVNCVNLCQQLPWLKDFTNQAQMVFCDGDGVRWGARLLGHQAPPKITYDRWIWQLAELAEQKHYRFFFLGGKPGVAEAAAEKLRQRFPRLEIVGTHDGYFGKQGEQSERVIAAINRAKPDILVLGFGMPVQERWLRDHWRGIAAHIFLTGGAVFDYASGAAKRAPNWMIRYHLEWLHRLVREPKRLFKRYVVGNPLFMLRVMLEKWLPSMYQSPAASANAEKVDMAQPDEVPQSFSPDWLDQGTPLPEPNGMSYDATTIAAK
jgi:N-acetylglucosaminyldiphosphoundecaprenol N-acetyl-beta-D-mannosaminyltransferase